MKSLDLQPLGTTGLRISGGYVSEDFLAQLRGARAARLYQEIALNSASVGTILHLIKFLLAQVEWTVAPNEASKMPEQAKLNADFVETCRSDMSYSWSDTLLEALSMLTYGWAYMEIIYKIRRGPDMPAMLKSKYTDGKIGWRKIELRAQDTLERWEQDPGDLSISGMNQFDGFANRRVFIPIERAVLFRFDKHKNNPEGLSLFRNAVLSYTRLKRIEEYEVIGFERDLAGMPVMEVPPEILQVDASAQDKQLRMALEKMLGEVKRDERDYILVPSETTADGKSSGYKFRLLRGEGGKQFDSVRVKESYKTDIFQTCLAQFLQLGQQQASGSHSLGDSQKDLFSTALISILENFRDTFQRFCIEPLCALNGINGDDVPMLKYGDITTPNLTELGAYITSLVAAGAYVPSEELERRLYKLAKLPYTPRPALEEGSVKTADELIAATLKKPGDVAPPAEGGVKTADQLIAEVKGKPAGGGVKTADQLIAEAKGPPAPTP